MDIGKKFKLLTVIVPEAKETSATERLTEAGCRGCISFPAQGMAKPSLLEYLGFLDNRKVLLMSMLKADDEAEIMGILDREIIEKGSNNTGIAFTCDIKGFIGLPGVFAEKLKQLDRQEN